VKGKAIEAIFAGILVIAASSIASPRNASATCVPTVPSSGDVLIAGGAELKSIAGVVESIAINDAEIFQTATQTFVATCPMTARRIGPGVLGVLVVPANGKATVANQILIVGGSRHGIFNNLNSTDLYDPMTGKFTRGGLDGQQFAAGVAVQLFDGSFLLL
jgi:hypothetical protein